MKKQKTSSSKRGFTLIELLVVISIIGLLSTLAVVSLNNARQKSRDAKRKSDLAQIQTSMELYADDNNGAYPVAATCLLVDGAVNSYLASFPSDPGTNTYTCASTATTYCFTANLELADYWYISHAGKGTHTSAACP